MRCRYTGVEGLGTVMGDASQHAALSPSARHRWGACPGSVREEAKYDEPEDSKPAIDGTRSHALLERALTYPGFIIANSVGTEVTDQYGTFTIEQDRVDRVQHALTYIANRAKQEGTTPITERRVHPDGLVGRDDMSGTVDCQIPGKDVYEIIDYKDGIGRVEARDNPQLLQYAVGVLAGLEEKAWPKSFNLTIIQPKLMLRGQAPIDSWNISTNGVLRAAKEMKAQADATDDPNAPLVPGEKQCQWCKAKGACPALKEKVMTDMGMLTPVDVDLAEQAARKDPTKMDGEELAKILHSAPLMRQLLDGVEKEVQSRLERGEVVPGYKLVRGRGSKGWALSQEEIEKKLTGMRIPKSALYPKKIISPAQVAKLVWEKDGENVRLTADQIKRVENEWVAYSQGAITVAPEADSRPGITVDASAMFTVEVQAEPVAPPAAALPPWLQAAPPAAPVVATVTPPWLVK